VLPKLILFERELLCPADFGTPEFEPREKTPIESETRREEEGVMGSLAVRCADGDFGGWRGA
jgi:hypothetical protein